ncbi:AMP-binding protein, partial [Aquabacterium parvum]|uniref:AMP-binding protein n=1 Tax=Aquabacterium parvum TaxID=70584 RepID=UPI000A435811
MTRIAPSERSSHPRNFVEHMLGLAQERPQETALIIVREHDGRPIDIPITYQALDQRVRALAATLQARFHQGDRVLLLLDNDDHYVVGFLACLFAGLIAVPVFPPESARPQHLDRLSGIAQDAHASCVLATGAMLERLGAAMVSFAGCQAIAVDGIDVGQADAWRPHVPSDDDIAFLQYTSGSTSAPKGVMVGHGHLLANERAIEEGLGMVQGDVLVSWLPLYHDMGLIGALLQALHRGIPIALMTPSFFLEKPVRWLEAISRLRGTVSGGPDFAYRLCVDRVGEAQRAGLDLSGWRLAFSGAEPVRQETLRDFASHFESAGFDVRAIYPCYGLAEATLFVTGGRRGQGMTAHAWHALALTQGRAQKAEVGTMLVACGEAASGHAIDIVDPQTLAALPDGQVGEVWASGPSVTGGYWRRPVETAQSFVMRGDGRWLRTGDMGFVSEGQLFITGRIKDLIILRGQNVYPQDIERAIELDVEAIRKGRIAAFSVHMADGHEGVGVAVEVSLGMRKLVPAQALVEALNVVVAGVCRQPASVILLLNPGALPKTSSGKLQRGACRDGWIGRTLGAYAIWEQGRFVLNGQSEEKLAMPAAVIADPGDQVAHLLANWWSSQLKLSSPPAPDSHFFAAGGDSLRAAQLAARIADQWGLVFPSRLVFEHARFGELLSVVRQAMAADVNQGRARHVAIPSITASQRGGPLPLSHAQERQWFLWQLDPLSSAYNIGFALHMEGELHAQALRQAIDDTIGSHEALRTVFRASESGTPEQWIGLPGAVDLPLIDLSAAGGDETALEVALRDVVDRPFDLSKGPLLRVALVRQGPVRHVLSVVMHHIVSDGASMQIFIDELARRYVALLSGQPWVDRPSALQHADHSVWQRHWLESGEAVRQLAWWRGALGDHHPVLQLPADHARSAAV